MTALINGTRTLVFKSFLLTDFISSSPSASQFSLNESWEEIGAFWDITPVVSTVTTDDTVISIENESYYLKVLERNTSLWKNKDYSFRLQYSATGKTKIF